MDANFLSTRNQTATRLTDRIFTMLRFAAATALSLLPLAAQTQDAAKVLADFVEAARSQPVEYFSDVFFRLHEANRFRDWAQILKLLEEVFQRAAEARQALPVQPARLVVTSEQARILVQAQRFRVQRIPIQARVIDLMANLNPQRAREMLREIVPPSQNRPSCGDALVSNPASFYETMQRVMQNAAGAGEAVRREGLRVLEDHIRSLTNAPQIGPVADIARLYLPADTDGVLVTDLGAALSNVQDSDRAFSFAVEQMGLVDSVLNFADAARQRQQPVVGLIASLRGFLLRHYTGNRCADNVPVEAAAWMTPPNQLRPIEQFNARGIRMASGLEPILPKDRVPGRVESSFPSAEPSTRTMYVHINERITQLRSARRDENWPGQATEVVRSIEEFRPPDGVAAAETFHQKALLFRLMLETLPSGALFRQVLADQIRLLLETPLRRDSPAEWLYHVDALLELARRARPAPSREDQTRNQMLGYASFASGHPAGQEVIEAMASSYDPLLSLYGKLERLAPLR